MVRSQREKRAGTSACFSLIFQNWCPLDLKFYLQSHLGPSCCVAQVCYPIKKLQAWQELLIQHDMGEQKGLGAMSYGAQGGRGWRGAQLPGLWRDCFGSKSEAKATRCP